MTPGSDLPVEEGVRGSFAVLDLGTNTFRLLIASLNPHQQLIRQRLERRIVRMGAGVAAHGTIAEESLARGIRALHELRAVIGATPVAGMTAVATGVFRDAANATQSLGRLSEALFSPIHLLSGRQEGAHTLAGVRAGLACTAAAPTLVVDVGGGSTESVRIAPDGSVSVQSVPLGAVYLKESVGRAYPLRPADLVALRRRALRAVQGLDLATGPSASPCIGTGGSITTLAWIALGLTHYDPAKIHGAVLTGSMVERVLSEALRLPCEALMGRYGLEQGRADLVVCGAVLTAEIIRRLPGGACRSVTMDCWKGSPWRS